MDNRKLIWGLAALLVVIAAAVFGYSLTRGPDTATTAQKTEVAKRTQAKLNQACASAATYDRLKELAFDEAVRIRNADPANLDTLARAAVVRMEAPVVKSRDEDLNVTVCTGRFVLELPPGAERGFGGERRLTADIEYSAQEAADGSGLVYQIEGADPIIYKLAAFDLKGGNAPVRQAAQPAPLEDPPVEIAAAPSEPDFAPAPVPAPRPPAPRPPVARPSEPEPDYEPAPRPAPAATVNARPSFNCRYARTRTEKLVCSDQDLAARDRTMASRYYRAVAESAPADKRAIRRTRDDFLARRERCSSTECVARTYDDRIAEIEELSSAR